MPCCRERMIPHATRVRRSAHADAFAPVSSAASMLMAPRKSRHGVACTNAAWVAAATCVTRSLHRLRQRDGRMFAMMTAADYFRTQTTRSTDAFASADPPVDVTPLAFRKPHLIGRHQRCVVAGGRTSPRRRRLQQGHAGERAVAIERRGTGKADRRRRRQRRRCRADRRRALALRHRCAAALILRIGDAGQHDVRSSPRQPASAIGFRSRAP